jgi:uncharacterized membrane protein
MDETLASGIHWIVRAIEVGGIGIIVLGAAVALFNFLLHLRGERRESRNGGLPLDLGRSILLGLEFLVAADIINTVAIEPNLDSLAVLAGIV